MLMVYQFYISGKKAIGQIGMSTWIGRDHHIFLPVSLAVSGFFPQFTLGGYQRGSILLFTNACTKFITGLFYSRTILAHKHELAFFRNGNRIHPVGILQYIILRDMIPIGSNISSQRTVNQGRRNRYLLLTVFHAFSFSSIMIPFVFDKSNVFLRIPQNEFIVGSLIKQSITSSIITKKKRFTK